MDVSQIKHSADTMFQVIQNAQQQKNETANKLIAMSLQEKVGGKGGNSPFTGHVLDITS